MSSPWEMVQGLDVGASQNVCRMGGANYPYDSRRYGDALAAEGYPLIRQWVCGDERPEAIAECHRFLSDAVSRGSIPMLTVAAVSLAASGDRTRQALVEFDPKTTAKFKSLLKMGAALSEYPSLFQQWRDTCNGLRTNEQERLPAAA